MIKLKSQFSALLFRVTVMSAGVASTMALAGPEGGDVVGGTGSISRNGSTTRIDQLSDRMAINWQNYDVSAGERVHYVQPDASSISLNRILSNHGSEIHGRIDANGQVFLINPNGVLFGQNAQINVGGMLASGLDINPNDFMNGDFAFRALENTEGAVLNSGLIHAATGGSVTLLGKQVTNEGLIVANLGRVNLAAGNEAVLTFDTEGLMGIRVTEEVLQSELGVDAAVANNGEITAEGGQVLLSASVSEDIFSQAVKLNGQAKSVVVHEDGSFTLGAGAAVVNTGTIQANSSEEKSGQIVFLGENVSTSGTLAAAGGDIELNASDITLVKDGSLVSTAQTQEGRGGNIKLLGKRVGLNGTVEVNASGAQGGGGIYTGGDYRGESAYLNNADDIYIGSGVNLQANSLLSGNGGRIINWANNSNRFYGSAYATGGVESGNGGFVEISAPNLDFLGEVNVASLAGDDEGTVLFDPTNITIQLSGSHNTQLTDDDRIFSGDMAGEVSDFTISAGVFEGATLSGNVILEATNNIRVAEAISLAENTNITSLSFVADAGASNGVGEFILDSPITTYGVPLSIKAASVDLNATVRTGWEPTDNAPDYGNTANSEVTNRSPDLTIQATHGDIDSSSHLLDADGWGIADNAALPGDSGGKVTLVADSGDINILGISNRGSTPSEPGSDRTGGAGGDVFLRAGGTITIGSEGINTEAGNPYASSELSGSPGGYVYMSSGSTITLNGDVFTGGSRRWSDSASNTAITNGKGGDIVLDGDVLINNASFSMDSRFANSNWTQSGHPDVLLPPNAGNIIITGTLDANNNNAAVTLYGNHISVGGNIGGGANGVLGNLALHGTGNIAIGGDGSGNTVVLGESLVFNSGIEGDANVPIASNNAVIASDHSYSINASSLLVASSTTFVDDLPGDKSGDGVDDNLVINDALSFQSGDITTTSQETLAITTSGSVGSGADTRGIYVGDIYSAGAVTLEGTIVRTGTIDMQLGSTGSVDIDALDGSVTTGQIDAHWAEVTIDSVATTQNRSSDITTGAIFTSNSSGIDFAGGDVTITSSGGDVEVDGIDTSGGRTPNSGSGADGLNGGDVEISGGSVKVTSAIDTSGTDGDDRQNSGTGWDGGTGGSVTITASSGDLEVAGIDTSGGNADAQGNDNGDDGSGGSAGNISLTASGNTISLGGDLTARGGRLHEASADTADDDTTDGVSGDISLSASAVELINNVTINTDLKDVPVSIPDNTKVITADYSKGDVTIAGNVTGDEYDLSLIAEHIIFGIASKSESTGNYTVIARNTLSVGSLEADSKTFQSSDISTFDTTSVDGTDYGVYISASDSETFVVNSSNVTRSLFLGAVNAFGVDGIESSRDGTVGRNIYLAGAPVTINGGVDASGGAAYDTGDTAGNGGDITIIVNDVEQNRGVSIAGAIDASAGVDFSDSASSGISLIDASGTNAVNVVLQAFALSDLGVTGSSNNADVFTGPNTNSVWSVSGTSVGIQREGFTESTDPTITLSSMENLQGGTAEDKFILGSDASQFIDGGDDNDTNDTVAMGHAFDSTWTINGGDDETVAWHDGTTDRSVRFSNIEIAEGNSTTAFEDTFNVSADVLDEYYGFGGNDTFNFSGAVTTAKVIGGAGSDRVTVSNDQSKTWRVDNTWDANSDADVSDVRWGDDLNTPDGDINFSGVEEFVGDENDDHFIVQAIDESVYNQLSFDGSGGTTGDTLEVRIAQNQTWDIDGSSSQTITWTTGDPGSEINWSIGFEDIESAISYTGNDIFNVSAGGFASLNGGSAGDTYNINGSSFNLEISDTGSSGNDTLQIGHQISRVWAIDGSNDVSWDHDSDDTTADITVTFSGIEIAKANETSAVVDTFKITADAISEVYGYGGDDVFEVEGVLDLEVFGGEGTDTIRLTHNYESSWTFDSEDTTPDIAWSDGDENHTVDFTDVETLEGGSRSDYFDIDIYIDFDINGRGGNDTFYISEAVDGTLQGGDGGDTFVIENGTVNYTVYGGDDSEGNPDKVQLDHGLASTWTIDGGTNEQVTWSAGTNSVTFSGIESLVGSSNDDTFNFSVNTATDIEVVDGRGTGTNGNKLQSSHAADEGSNAWNLSSETSGNFVHTIDESTNYLVGFSNIQILEGSPNIDDSLTGAADATGAGSDSNSTWRVDTPSGGSYKFTTDSDTTLTFSNMENLVGGSGSDTFNFIYNTTTPANSGSMALVDGGDGTDTLSAYDQDNSWAVGADGESGSVALASTPNTPYVVYEDIESLEGGTGSDSLNLSGINNNIAVSIGAFTSTDDLDDDTEISANGFDSVTGNDSDGTGLYRSLLIVNDATNTESTTWNITGENQGNINNGFSFIGFNTLWGDSEQDTFNVDNNVHGAFVVRNSTTNELLRSGVNGLGGNDIFNITTSIAGEINGGEGSDRFNVAAANLSLNLVGGVDLDGDGQPEARQSNDQLYSYTIGVDGVADFTGAANTWTIDDVGEGEYKNTEVTDAAVVLFAEMETVYGADAYSDIFSISHTNSGIILNAGESDGVTDVADYSSASTAEDNLLTIYLASDTGTGVVGAELIIGSNTGYSQLVGGAYADTFIVEDYDTTEIGYGTEGTADGENDGLVRITDEDNATVNQLRFINFTILSGAGGDDSFTVDGEVSSVGVLNGAGPLLDGSISDSYDVDADVFTLNGTLSGTINAGGGDDTFTIATGSTVTGTINGDGDSDTFDVHANVSGKLNGGTGSDTFNVDSGLDVILGGGGNTGDLLVLVAGDGVNATWDVDGEGTYETVVSNSGTVQFEGIDRVRSGGGDDTFNISSGSVNFLEGAGGDDVFNVAAGLQLRLYGGSYVDGTETDGDLGDLIDLETSLALTWTIDNDGSQTVVRTDGVGDTTTFSGMEVARGGSGVDTFNVTAASVGQLEGAGNADVFNIDSGLELRLYGGSYDADTDRETDDASGDLIDLNSSLAHTWKIDDDDSQTVARTDSVGGTTTFSGIEVTRGGSGIDTFDVTAASVRQLEGAGNSDVFNVASGLQLRLYGGSYDADTGEIDNAEGDLINVNTALALTWAIDDDGSQTVVQTSVEGDITTFSGMDVARGGSGVDTFNVTAATVSKLEGSAGSDVFEVNAGLDVSLFGYHETGVDEDAGSDKFTFVSDPENNGITTWSITGSNNNKVGAIQFSGIEELVGGTGADTFEVSAEVDSIIGGDADGVYDTIETPGNTGYTWEISADGNSITGLVGRFSGIENLIGGNGADTFSFIGEAKVDGSIYGRNPGDEADPGDTLNLEDYTKDYWVNISIAGSGTGSTPQSDEQTLLDFNAWEIETVVHGDEENQLRGLIGTDSATDWYIVGNNVIKVGEQEYEGYNSIRGGAALDRFFFGDTDGSRVGVLSGRIDGGTADGDTQPSDSIYGPMTATSGTLWNVSGEGSGDITVTYTPAAPDPSITETIGFENIESIIGRNNLGNTFVVDSGNTSTSSMNITGGTGVDVFVVNTALTGSINGEGGADKFYISDRVTGDILGGAGSDQFYVSYNGAINVDGSTGVNDQLTVDYGAKWDHNTEERLEIVASDEDTTTIAAWNLPATGTTYVGSVTFSNFDTLNGSEAPDRLTITDNLPSSSMTFNALGGTDSVTYNRPSAINASWTFSESLGESKIANTTVNSRELFINGFENATGSDGVDIFNVDISMGDLSGLGGDDVYNVGASGIVFTATGGSDTDTLIAFDDSENTNAWVVVDGTNTLTNTTDADVTPGIISFSEIENLQGGTGKDTFNVTAEVTGWIDGRNGDDEFTLAENVVGNVYGGNGDDTFTVSSEAFTADIFGGTRPGNGEELDDSNTDGDELIAAFLSDFVIRETGAGRLNNRNEFSQIELLTGSTAADTFTLQNTGISIGIDGNGSASVNDTLQVVESDEAFYTNWLVGETGSITYLPSGSTSDGEVTFSNIEILIAGGGDDRMEIATTATGIYSVAGGAGNDVIRIGVTADGGVSGNGGNDTVQLLAGGLSMNVYGGDDSELSDTLVGDTLVGADVANTWTTTAMNAGTVGSVTFDGFENATGGTANDTFVFEQAAANDQYLFEGVVLGGDNDEPSIVDPLNPQFTEDTFGDAIDATALTGDLVLAQELTRSPDPSNPSDPKIAISFFEFELVEVSASDDLREIRSDSSANTWQLFNGFTMLKNYENADDSDPRSTAYLRGFNEILGGDGDDVFSLASNTYQKIDGGGGAGRDTIDYSYVDGPVAINISNNVGQGQGIIGIEGATGYLPDYEGTRYRRALIGLDDRATWTIDGENDGKYSTGDGAGDTNMEFTNFDTLVGGSGNDFFNFEGDGNITGGIIGGDGNDVVNAFFNDSDRDSIVDLAFQLIPVVGNEAITKETPNAISALSLETEITEFHGIETVNANSDNENRLVGLNAVTAWTVNGSDGGYIGEDGDRLLTFTGFGSLTGGSLADTFTFTSGASLSGTLDGGANTTGQDEVNITALADGALVGFGEGVTETVDLLIDNVESLVANGSSNGLYAGSSDNEWNITGDNIGTVTSVDDEGNTSELGFTAFGSLFGNIGDDEFVVTGENQLSGLIVGGDGEGSDTLNMQAATRSDNEVDVVIVDSISAEHAAGVDFAVFGIEELQGTTEEGQTSTLHGQNIANTWLISSANAGTLNSNVSFTNFQNLIGASTNNDVFRFVVAENVSGSIEGYVDGLGQSPTEQNPYGDIVDMSALPEVDIQVAANGSSTGYINIERFVGNSNNTANANSSRLRATNAGSYWNVTGADSGTLGEDAATSFYGFNYLYGGDGEDDFVVSEGGAVSGFIDAAANDDSIDITLAAQPNGSISFIGGAHGENGDSLVVRGGDAALDVIYTPETGEPGESQLAYSSEAGDNYLIGFSETESINDQASAALLVVEDTSSADSIVLDANTISGVGATLQYTNKNSLRVEADSDDSIRIDNAIQLPDGQLTLERASVLIGENASVNADTLLFDSTGMVGSETQRLSINVDTLRVRDANEGVYLQEQNQIDFAELSTSGVLDIVATGTITDSAPLTMLGESSRLLLESSNGNIALDDNGSLAGSLGLTASNGHVNVRSSGRLSLLNLSAESGDLNAGGGIAASGPVLIEDQLNLAASGNITLENAANDFDSVAIINADNVSLVDQNRLILNGAKLSGELDIEAVGLAINDTVDALAANFNAQGASASINSTVTVTNSLAVDAMGIELLGAASGRDVRLNASQEMLNINATVSANGGEAKLSGQNINQNAAVSATVAVDMLAENNIVQTALINGGTVSVEANTGAVTMERGAQTRGTTVAYSAETNLALANIDASSFTGRANAGITQRGLIQTTGDINLAAEQLSMQAGSQTIATTGTVSIDTNSSAVLESVSGNQGVSVQSDGTISTQGRLDSSAGDVTVAGNGITLRGPISAAGVRVTDSNGGVTLGNSIEATSGDIEIASNAAMITQEGVLRAADGDILVAGDSIAMASGTNSESLNGDISYTASGDVQVAGLHTSNLLTINSRMGAVRGVDTGFSLIAGSADINAETGISGAGQNATLGLSVDMLSLTNNNGLVAFSNDKAMTLSKLRNNDTVDLRILSGDLTIDNIEDNLYVEGETDAREAGGVFNANFDVGTINLTIAEGSLFATGRAFTNQPDVVAESAFINATGGVGLIGTPARPIVFYVKDTLVPDAARIYRRWAFNHRPPNYVPTGTDIDPSQAGNLGAEQLIEVEELEEIDPAVFTAVSNFFFDDVSIRLPNDQLYDDELEEYEEGE